MKNQLSAGLSLTWKLYIPFAFLFFLFCGLGFFSLRLIYQLETITSGLHSEVAGFARLNDLHRLLADQRSILASLVLSQNSEDILKAEQLLVLNRNEFIQACSIYEKYVFLSESDHLYDNFESQAENYLLEVDVTVRLAVQGKMQEAQEYMRTTAASAFREVLGALNQLRKASERQARTAHESSGQVYYQGKVVLLIAIIMVSIGTIMIARFMRFSLFVPILNLTRAITRLASSDLKVEIPEQNRNDELGKMAHAVKELQKTACAQQQTAWVRSQLQKISQEIQQSEEINEFTATLLQKLAPALNAQVAAFYTYNPHEIAFVQTGGYALLTDTQQTRSFRLNEGLIGQCAADKTIKIFSGIQHGNLAISSGIAEGIPAQLVMAPVVAPHGEVLAVLEFAAINPLESHHHELLAEILPLLALNLQIIERNQHTRALLQESQKHTIELADQARQIFASQKEIQEQRDQLLNTNSELAQKSDELESTLQRLEEATRVKNVFLANMSHEIRTPMNAVIGMSHLCLKTELTDKQKDYIEKIQQAGFSLLEIINNILDFSKLGDGNMKVRNSMFNIAELISKQSNEFSMKARNKGLDFTTQVDRELPLNLYGDQGRIGQILHQLLANAVKFTEKGQIRLNVSAKERNLEQVKLRFEVYDTGIGLNETQISQMFQPFQQIDGSSTRQFSGTGIGLALSKRLAEMLDGTIDVTSKPGKGSTFSFEVWCQIAEATSPKAMTVSIEGLHVLVVDDSSVDRQILKEQLDAAGMRVAVCGNGAEALNAIKQVDADDPFKIVFMDWRLPGGDGVEIIKQIEAMPTKSAKPAIIMVTAFEIEDVRDQAELAGVQAFLPKPVTPSNLWASLAKAFGSPVPVPASDSKTGDPAKTLRGMRILLVEDNDLNQQIASELLQSVGITVTVAGNGKMALELLRSAPDPLPYDLILMDIQMPVMDGHQATLELRKDQRFKTIPIIALTAHALEEEKNLCFEEGMNGHISKPIDPLLLFRLLANWYKQDAKSAGSVADSNHKPLLDRKAGLRRVAGNQRLYSNLLQKFCEGQANAIATIRQALRESDRSTAQRVSHTLKGIAGNIGALPLQNAAAALEKAIKLDAATAEIEELLISCEEIFAKTAGEIQDNKATTKHGRSETRKPQQAEVSPTDTTSSGRLLKHLQHLLSQSDGESEDYLILHETALTKLLGQEAIDKLRAALSGYDFDQALLHLQNAATARHITL